MQTSYRNFYSVRKKVPPCENFAEDILKVYGLNVKSDETGRHSKFICTGCRRVFYSPTKNENVTKILPDCSSVWEDFDPAVEIGDCKVCSQFNKQSKKGRRVFVCVSICVCMWPCFIVSVLE